MHIFIVPVVGVLLLTQLERVGANLSLDFRVTKISASPANCNVANTTYAHGETFKLDCRTQCVCENGRHACSSLCPKEQLPAPEDTISCRSPRLVEVPGHCCKMWLCENPTADVYATCHNSSSSPWTPCSQPCGLGISTRFTATTAGCNQLINQRLCQNRKCELKSPWVKNNARNPTTDDFAVTSQNYLRNGADDIENIERYHHHHHHHNHKKDGNFQLGQEQHKHGNKKGHDCRHLERLGPARIRLGQCVSRKLYRPKVCGPCHQPTKCCLPSVSTTIQVELLCPLNAADPISIVQQQEQQRHHQEFYSASALTSLWDTQSLDAIDQEYFQSHQIHIQNKFVAIEWILKCECSENESCQRIVKPQRRDHHRSAINISHEDVEGVIDDGNDVNDDNYSNNVNYINNNNVKTNNDNNYNNGDYNNYYSKMKRNNYKVEQQPRQKEWQTHFADKMPEQLNADVDEDTSDVISDARFMDEERENWPTSSLSSPPSMSANSDESQPDIIPYPPPPFTTNKQTNINNSNKQMDSGSMDSKKYNDPLVQTAKSRDEETYRNERQREQEKYFYEQWLRQQQQQKRQQSLMDQLLGT
ncbi:myb-like protein F [Stomoxys calcitrans]|uniref:myb-like protein F n=1 Tax=Stomoxys calcitrans TaxID=35570 RepID=UPI0027E2C709|nr:myb-like protein F [Stomoxys calcitrans]XP_059218717.1 myb-like protein F [Stomoxys calcitrans]XP_059218724.1 myb-like protein F [Stomoxys calcitrans]XP_059218736.1 myb-like protein F [Stomoxys calcitrans]XP_059218739.1 myb-like protein F [Stomoxys calcitrans]